MMGPGMGMGNPGMMGNGMMGNPNMGMMGNPAMMGNPNMGMDGGWNNQGSLPRKIPLTILIVKFDSSGFFARGKSKSTQRCAINRALF